MSKIEVNTVAPQCGTTLTLGESGDTVTLGRCGGTVSLASGATQSGFGRTGTVDWCTTAKTGPLTAVSGKGYFINTCGGAITVTLPSSPSAGDIVSVCDYASTFQNNALTLGRNSSKIANASSDLVVNTEGAGFGLVYSGSNVGWTYTEK